MTRQTSVLERRRGEFQAALLSWYRTERRRLPWREQPSLYRTVVSEFMLQQTQVRTVLPYFERWMAALPDFQALAAAPADRVLKLWEGLGYYSRARNLHRLARVVASRPEPPRTAAGWAELPGIGPYTAAAIASIAQDEPAACVDGNVVRILSRLTADDRQFRDSASASKAFAGLAGAILNPSAPGDHNQAMMELGATVCLKRRPACLVCPVGAFCAAVERGEPESFPRLAAKPTERVAVVRVWCERDATLLLHRASLGARRLALLYELPTAAQAGFDPHQAAQAPLLAKKSRSITRFRITESIHAAPFPRRKLLPGLAWIPLSRLESLTLSGPHRRWVREIMAQEFPLRLGADERKRAPIKK